MATRTCRFHCASCDRHFTSLSAFDLHRQGDYDSRHCADPAEDQRFVLRADDGECRICAAVIRGIDIWGIEVKDLERLSSLRTQA